MQLAAAVVMSRSLARGLGGCLRDALARGDAARAPRGALARPLARGFRGTATAGEEGEGDESSWTAYEDRPAHAVGAFRHQWRGALAQPQVQQGHELQRRGARQDAPSGPPPPRQVQPAHPGAARYAERPRARLSRRAALPPPRSPRAERTSVPSRPHGPRRGAPPRHVHPHRRSGVQEVQRHVQSPARLVHHDRDKGSIYHILKNWPKNTSSSSS